MLVSGSEIYGPSGNATVPNFVIESTGDGITAHAGGGQTNATPLTREINRITTVATIGDSVLLPPSAAGLSIVVINNGANSVQVYGAGTDTIDGVAYATGVNQMVGSSCIFFCTTAGSWSSNGIGEGYAGSFLTNSYTNSIVAHAGGGQASGTLITTVLNRVTTVATGGDSILLPASVAGMEITVANAGANSLNLFPATGDKIGTGAANAAYALAANITVALTCMVAGQWHAISGS